MKTSFTIIRHPNAAGLKRGPNMMRIMCQKCLEDKTHGFKLFDYELLKCAIFICDDCLSKSKKETRQ